MKSRPCSLLAKISFHSVFFAACFGIAAAVDIPSDFLSDLSNENFRKREDAQAGLLEWVRGLGEPAAEALLGLSVATTDPEVRERCSGVLRDWVSDEYLKNGKGYVGIMMQDELAVVQGDPKPRCVIRVTHVVPDSAAEKAGLQLNDLVVGLGDETWHDGSASNSFKARIQDFKPNTKVKLRILRNGNPSDIEVVLGKRPAILEQQEFIDPFLNPGQLDLEGAERDAKEDHFRKWLERKKSVK